MKLYANLLSGESFRSKQAAIDASITEVDVDDVAPAWLEAVVYHASDDCGDSLVTPFQTDLLDWIAGRSGVSIQTLTLRD